MNAQVSVAIVGGTGSLGNALALRLGAPGVKVIIGSRDAQKAQKAVESLKPKMRAGELAGVDAHLGDVLVCGDDEEAKQKVMEIIRRIGARPFDGGPAANAYVIEGLTGVIIHLDRKYKSKHGSIKIIGIGD